MADGCRREAWQRTSLLAAISFNQWRNKSEMRDSHAFDPYEQTRRRGNRITPATIGQLKIFLKNEVVGG